MKEVKMPQAAVTQSGDDPQLVRFWTLAEEALTLKNEDSFQSRLTSKEPTAISSLVAVNVEMNQLRQQLNNAGVPVPQMNDIEADDLAEWKATLDRKLQEKRIPAGETLGLPSSLRP